MEKILYLVHRIPYPPNKGDKIRSYHFLKQLAQHYQVFLATFIDDEADWSYQEQLHDYCQNVYCAGLNPQLAKLKSLAGLLSGQALSLPYYQNQALQHWVDDTLAQQGIKKVVVFSSAMAQFVMDKPDIDMIVDFVDVDSDKWRQYAEKKTGPESWIYHREAKKLFEFEKHVAARSTSSFFVSRQEAELFKQLAPACQDKVGWVNNGVDTVFFDPELNDPSPYSATEQALVFTGAMDYWPNIDAVTWFAEQVFPHIQKTFPRVKFYIVGSKPTKEVLALADTNQGIVVTGRVDDVRPFLKHAAIAVAPLRVARGIQNKVLEAMAMKKTIAATAAAMEGIEGFDALDVIQENDAEALAKVIVKRLGLDASSLHSDKNRHFVEQNFSWASSGQALLKEMNG